jgi:hypothetical protein
VEQGKASSADFGEREIINQGNTMSASANKESRPLPAGWQIVVNEQFVSQEEREAQAFAATILADFQNLWNLYTRSDNQALLFANAPSDRIIDRARSIVYERGHRNLLVWCRVVGGLRIVRLDVFPQSTRFVH